MASDAMTADRTYTSQGVNTAGNPLDQYGYIYQYDARNRMIAKKLPGTGWTQMVYDRADRLVLSQEGVVHPDSVSKEWWYNKYDALGRIVMRGLYYDGNNAQVLRQKFAD
jgi:YD repeat-containing protein